MAKKKRIKMSRMMILGLVILLLVGGYILLNQESSDIDNPNAVFTYNGYHKYTYNQYQPSDACYDRYYEYRDAGGIESEGDDVTCTGTSEDDLNIGGNLKCTCG